MTRDPRDQRGPDEPRDSRDTRRPDDPRDERDPRLSDDPRDALDVNGVAPIARPDVPRRVPRYVKLIAAVALTGSAVVAGVAWQVADARDDQRQRDCLRAVAVRDDNRAMWLYVTGLATIDPKTAASFLAELNKRLPPLRCVDGSPVPR